MGLLADVFSGGEIPDAPKTKKEVKGLKEWANSYLKPLYEQQVAYARDYVKRSGDTQQTVLEQTLPMMEEMFNAYRTDRNRYEQTFVPLQDQIIQYAQGYDTPERREEEAARRISEVSQSFAAERDNAQRRLESYGIDPSQTRTAALDRDIRAQEAMAQAQAGNQGRLDVETRGQALLQGAQAMGQNLPQQALASGQLGTGVGQSALSGQNQAGQTAGNLMAQPVGTAQQASSNLYNAGGLKLGQFGAASGEYGMKRQQTGDVWSGIGGLADTASTFMMLADGGYVDKYINEAMDPGVLRGEYKSFDKDTFNVLSGATPSLSADQSKSYEATGVKDPYNLSTGMDSQNYEAALGITDMMPFADGGSAVIDKQGIQAENADRVPALLSHGEYVIPADVVRVKGTEFFDKLNEKYHTASEQQGAQAQMSTRHNLNGGIPVLRDGGVPCRR